MNFLDNLSKFLPFVKSNAQDEYFFALNISPKRVDAALWGIDGKKLQIIASSHSSYGSDEDLTKAANMVLDQALADFQPEPEKILFGVPEDWLQDDNLKMEKLEVLKGMVKDLGVTPMAYVSTTQAVSHYLQKVQGVPPTAVLVEIADPLNISVIKAGKIVASKNQKRTGNLPQDLEKALLTFGDVEVLPAKILIFAHSVEDWEKLKDELLSFPWMSQLPFLHLPKIDVLEDGIDLISICLAGGFEINPHVSIHTDDLNLRLPLYPEKTIPPEEKLGFVPDDVAKFRGDEGGILKEPIDERLPARRAVVLDNEENFLHRDEAAPKLDVATLTQIVKDKIPSKMGVALILPTLILFLFLAGMLFLPKAKVTIFIDLRILEKDSQVIADPVLKVVDEANKIIPGKIVETTVSGSSKTQATGKKQIGDPAKGTVLIYNKTSSAKTFSQGTVLIGPSGLTFILDSSVNVASSSAVEGGIAFGKTTGNVTASNIGPDGNLPAGTELTIKDQPSSSISAKTDNAFSGGISKDVTVVTSDDQKKLLAQVTSDLRKKAQDDLQGKLPANQKILGEALLENLTSQSYSKGVNDQASEFSLNVTAHYRGTAYNEDDLKMIVSKLVETNVPDGYVLDLSKTETQAQVSKIDKDGKLYFVSKFRAKLMPKLDLEKLKKDLAGKSVDQAVEKVKTIENVIGSEIELKPKIPIKKLQRLPFLPQNITIEVTAK